MRDEELTEYDEMRFAKEVKARSVDQTRPFLENTSSSSPFSVSRVFVSFKTLVRGYP